MTKYDKSYTHEQADTKGIGQTDKITVADTLSVAGTKILPHKTTASGIEGCHYIVNKGIRVGCSCIARHHSGIKGVNPCLYKQIGNLKYGILKSCRNTNLDNIHGFAPAHSQFRLIQPVNLFAPEKRNGNHGG